MNFFVFVAPSDRYPPKKFLIHDEVGGPPKIFFQLLRIHHEVGGPPFDQEPPKNFFELLQIHDEVRDSH